MHNTNHNRYFKIILKIFFLLRNDQEFYLYLEEADKCMAICSKGTEWGIFLCSYFRFVSTSSKLLCLPLLLHFSSMLYNTKIPSHLWSLNLRLRTLILSLHLLSWPISKTQICLKDLMVPLHISRLLLPSKNLTSHTPLPQSSFLLYPAPPPASGLFETNRIRFLILSSTPRQPKNKYPNERMSATFMQYS